MKTIQYNLLILLALIISISTVYSESEKKAIQTLTAPEWVKPANDTTIPPVFNLNWSAVEGAEWYDACILNINLDTVFTNRTIMTFSSYFKTNNPCSKYYCFVRAVNKTESGPLSKKLTLYPEAPYKDTLLSPPDNSNVKEADTLSWIGGWQASFIEIDTSILFNTGIYYSKLLDYSRFQNKFPIYSLLPNTKYYWRVSDNKCSAIGQPTEPWSFKTDNSFSYKARPVLVFPEDSSKNISPQLPVFRWKKTDGNDSYMLSLSKYHDFYSPDFYLYVDNDKTKDTIEFSSKIILNNNTEYYWMVKSVYDVYDDPFTESNIFKFKTGLTIGIPEFPDIQNPISITPNPASDFLNIHLSDKISDNKIEIFNIFGIRIINEVVETKNLKLDIHTFPVGIYLIKTYKYSKLIIKN